MIKKEYTKGDLTVVWQPELCIHSAVCFNQLPEVFKPRDRPWVQMEAADIEQIRETVHACPSGALSIKPAPSPFPATEPELVHPKATVKIFENGPVRVLGPCDITMADGSIVEKLNGVSFCRCGGSKNLPFCDASHKTNGFKG